MAKTKKEMFAEIREMVIDNAEMVAFIDHELELLNRKRSGSKKPTKVQLENEAFKADILEYLTREDAPKCIKDIQADVEGFGELSHQRIVHMLTALEKDGKVDKSKIKRICYYSIANVGGEEE